MFVCQVSGKQSAPGEKPYRLVTKTRRKNYKNTIERIVDGEKKKFDINSTGWEIVEEKLVCEEVFNRLNRSK